ncbi:DUF1501 domain-containing protein [Pelagicoccus mobilis]|uniref:DUF1501 domain-containing protein n=1 Tax=Pelagicoccus mobilis TaxID=415221 RepID=A0A934RTQ4_9BACT|nr:DUF1501 domain-containing protein [Pelagicoccus mobilis]MBK1876206.1 DUF1501 domain-containing protein [Pelagicoccus mobilis]
MRHHPSTQYFMSRRDLIRSGILFSLGLPFFRLNESLGATLAHAPKQRATSVIEIWMWGGPSHLDTFDPKPEAGAEFCGPYSEAIKTNVDGIRINSRLPLLAKQADKYSLIRSMTHGINAHETATYRVQTGRESGGAHVYPSIGAVVSKLTGYEAGYQGLLPPYIALTSTHGRFSEEGFLGPSFKPFATGGDPNAQRFMVEGIISRSISDQRQTKRRQLLQNLDTLGKTHGDHPLFREFDTSTSNAYDMILGEAREVFDLSQEKDELRDRYGRHSFGQSCLMARRLVENGVKYVTLNAKGWDTHKMHFTTMEQKMPQMDQGIASLLQDLDERGMLDSTIVWVCGEFGRTPKVQWKEPWKGGRGHFGRCFSALVAGGGFKAGQVVGASNSTGEEVADRPVYPEDLIGSIYDRLGIAPTGRMPNNLGLDIPLTPKSKGPGILSEIM